VERFFLIRGLIDEFRRSPQENLLPLVFKPLKPKGRTVVCETVPGRRNLPRFDRRDFSFIIFVYLGRDSF
jgi:hypothetical protein